MRIISGIAGGIRLAPPKNADIRPTTDRVKESMFAILGDLRGLRVLDLFAGTGALGLEALSRGAGEVVFVENNIRHLRLIEKNLAAVKKAMGDQFTQAQALRGDASRVASLPALAGRRFDIILADPPYQGTPGPRELLAAPGFAAFAGAAMVVIEHDREIHLDTAPTSPWELLRQSVYGTTQVSYVRRKATS
ncbi:MAG: 16S rRNA (guanine(966)-N(2))-methyltransferase RsmD [Lentisphaeria bacterium]|nr:16S rRNA (guanine(966)-N(2))-methyltransferase RsmD [Lentisphaeria bacterium]